jgi:hypothetical protein
MKKMCQGVIRVVAEEMARFSFKYSLKSNENLFCLDIFQIIYKFQILFQIFQSGFSSVTRHRRRYTKAVKSF